MKYELYNSIDEMLVPEALCELAKMSIRYVRCLPFGYRGYSGSRFMAIETNGGEGPRYTLKRTAPEWDWLMQATRDHRCCSVRLWQSGLLDQLKPEVEHAIVACAKEGDGWALLMHDVSAGLIDEMVTTDRPLRLRLHKQILDAMAAMHAGFWEPPELTQPTPGLCTLPGLFDALSLQTAMNEPSTTSILPAAILEGWQLLLASVEPDVADILGALQANPQPLCDACRRHPFTLVHGDWKLPNLSSIRGHRLQIVALDWQLATSAPATFDLDRFLASTDNPLPVSHEVSPAYYRQRLARRLGERFDERGWQAMLELGWLGFILLYGSLRAWWVAHHKYATRAATARATVEKFNQQTRAAVRWL